MANTKPRSDQIRFDNTYLGSTIVGVDSQAAIEELDAQLQTSGADAAALESRVSTAEGNITSNDTDIADLQGRATATEGVDTTQNGRLDALETFQSGADAAYVNAVGEETITGSLVVDNVKIDGSAITTADASSLTLGESGETVIVPGNLSVSGTTTTVNSNEVNVGDAVIKLNSDVPTATAPTEDGGFEVYRGDPANGGEQSALLVFQESTDTFVTSVDGGTTYRNLAYSDELAAQAAAQQAAIDANTAAITSNDTDIANLQSADTASEARITTLETEMDAVESRATALESQATTTDTEQAAQDTAIASNSTRLDTLEATSGTRSVMGDYSIDTYAPAAPGTTFSMMRAASPQFANVWLNGINLVGSGANADYSIVGTTVVLTESTVAGDSVRIEAFNSISV